MAEDTFHLDKQQLMRRSVEQMADAMPIANFTTYEKVALTCRILFDNGHDSGLAGQITARGDLPGTFITQRLGLGFDEIGVGNLLLDDENLQVLDGAGVANPANRFHAWVYRARLDVSCIIHTHATYTAALSMLEVPLVISHMDNCVLYDDVAFLAV